MRFLWLFISDAILGYLVQKIVVLSVRQVRGHRGTTAESLQDVVYHI